MWWEDPGMPMDPLTAARTLIAHRFPHARWAILTGSVLTAARTPGSDLDIVVLLPDDDPLAPGRESLRFADWPVELFIHHADSIEHYLTREFAERRPALCRMLA